MKSFMTPVTHARDENQNVPPDSLVRGSLQPGQGCPGYNASMIYMEEISIEKEALVDSGATNNVLPYHVGLELGLSCMRRFL